MKDIIDLLTQEKQRLLATAQPFLDQAAKIDLAIKAMAEEEGADYTPRVRVVPKQTRDGSPVNAPRGERTKVVQDAVANYLGVDSAATDDIIKHLKGIGVFKKSAKKAILAAYLCYRNRFTYGSDGLWRVTKKLAA